jgi:hypothetical protein
MDPDSLKHDNLENNTTQESSLDLFDHSNLLQSSWIRRSIRFSNEVDGIFLGYGFNFLLPISCILWLVFLFTK